MSLWVRCAAGIWGFPFCIAPSFFFSFPSVFIRSGRSRLIQKKAGSRKSLAANMRNCQSPGGLDSSLHACFFKTLDLMADLIYLATHFSTHPVPHSFSNFLLSSYYLPSPGPSTFHHLLLIWSIKQMTLVLLLASLLQIMDLKLRKGTGPKSSSKLLVITTIRGFTLYFPPSQTLN